MLKHFFIPTKKNNFTPHLLHKTTISIYLAVLLLFNFTVAQFGFEGATAAIDAGTLYSLHNSNRSANGLSSLTQNSKLVSSATSKAQAMLDSDCWDHYCPAGTSPWTFFGNAGYYYIHAGENLGEGFSSSSSLMNAWMNSPTHRANVLNPDFKEIGIGFAYGEFQGNPNNTIVVVHFGSREDSPSPTNTPTPKPTATNTPKPTAVPPTPTKTQVIDIPDPTTPAANTPDPAPVIAEPEPTNIGDLTIEEPDNDSVTNDSKPQIEGKSPNNSEVEIFLNQESQGRVDSEGEYYTYRPNNDLEDDTYSLQAKAFDRTNNQEVASTESIEFTVDTLEPLIIDRTLEVSQGTRDSEPITTINFATTEAISSVTSNIQSAEFDKKTESEWSISFFSSDLEQSTIIEIYLEDKSGNQSTKEYNSEEILGANSIKEVSTNFEESPTKVAASSSLFGISLDQANRTNINIFFVGLLFTLFSIDFYVLHKTGLTGLARGKSHLHIAALVVLTLVTFITTLSGNIL